MAELIDTQGWSEIIVQDLSEIASLETQEEVISLLKRVADQLDMFLIGFKGLQKDIIGIEQHKTMVKKYRSQIKSNTDISKMMDNYDENRQKVEEQILFTNLLNYMKSGYYLLNKIRDILFEPITYAIGFKDKEGNTLYIDNVEIEQLLSGVTSLSNRVRITENNFARLEIDLKDMLSNVNVKNADDDPLYTEITAYTSTHKHTYLNQEGVYRSKKFSDGYIWETYRHMKLYEIPFSDKSVQAIYEEVRRGNLIYTKGGDVLAEQDKFGTQVALTSMATINDQLGALIQALRCDDAQSISQSLQKIFIQDTTEEVDNHLSEYIDNDVNKLLGLLKLDK